MANVILFYLVLIASCVYALFRGGWPERAVAIAFILASLGSFALQRQPALAFRTVEFGVLGVDVGLLLILVAVALKADRYWPIWIAGVQLLAVAIHLAKLYAAAIPAWMYFVAASRMSYPMLAMLVIGTWRHRRRLMQMPTGPAWQPS